VRLEAQLLVRLYSILLCVAMLLCLAGTVSFEAALARTSPSTDEKASLFLAVVLAVAPLLLAVPTAYELWDPRAYQPVVGLRARRALGSVGALAGHPAGCRRDHLCIGLDKTASLGETRLDPAAASILA